MRTIPTTELTFFVNGVKVIEPNPDPERTLLQYLRTGLHLTGTKLGCGEGGCGACTVMVSRYDRVKHKILHFCANACLVPVCAMHGAAVTTVEGIGSTKTRLHPVQERLAKAHGSQCGFCTPGMVMSMYTLLRNNPHPSATEMEAMLQGNLCRCTGYRPILQGFGTFTEGPQCPMGTDCCQNQNTKEDRVSKPECTSLEQQQERELNIPLRRALVPTKDFAPYDPSQEPTFPSELQLDSSMDSSLVHFRNEQTRWYRPCALDQLLQLMAEYPEAKLLAGNTAVGCEMKFKNVHHPIIVALSHIPELRTVTEEVDGICVGAAVTLAELEQLLKEQINKLPETRSRLFAAVVEMLRWLGGPQVRNVSTIGGNVMTASPQSDLNPLWLAAGCRVTVTSKERGERHIVMDHNFFYIRNKTPLRSDEVLVNIKLHHTNENEHFRSFKQAYRRHLDFAIVNAAMRVTFTEASNNISDLCLAYGGMAPTTVMAVETMKGLVGRTWDDDLIPEACALLAKDLPLSPGAPGGSECYRRTLATSFFFKFYLQVLQNLKQCNRSSKELPDTYTSVLQSYCREPSHGSQVYEEVTGQPNDDPIGRPIVHKSALQQTTGEARYCDDIPRYENELYLALVLSTKAHARIISVDPSEALKERGVVDYINYKDVPGSNVTGPVFKDEEIFATDQVVCQGQTIGGILADDPVTARRAARLVKVQYEELEPIITIEQAIAANSYLYKPVRIKNGDVEAGFAQSDHILEGEVRVGGQEHFYMETQGCIAIPKGEDGEMEVIAPSQALTDTQMLISEALGVAANKIVCRVKRIGGSFGGKATRPHVVTTTAVAAYKHDVPVRIMLDRDEDMVLTGTRHPFLGRYKVGFTREGNIMAVQAQLYSNCGCSADVSPSVMETAVLAFDNSYRLPNFDVTGHLCRTNLASNTGFRGFGAPQGMMVCEQWMTHVADFLKVPQEQLRETNMYEEGDKTPYNMVLENCNIKRCWDTVKSQSNFDSRKQDIAVFNKRNRWVKRGISLNSMKYGLSFPSIFLNQAGALVHVYTDGSVLLSHAGVEIGQGLHTKMIQVASRVLQIPTDKIHISESSTDVVPNPSSAGASIQSDINGMAVMKACETIKQRLTSYVAAAPDDTWEKWVKAAYFDRVSLSATGFYKTPGIGYDIEKNEGQVYSYCTYGSACTEVEIDCLTGAHTVLRTDIVVDVGKSLNPAIDIGQIEGAFIQGYGLFVLEDQKYSPEGYLHTRGPGTYKIPGFSDIPIEFNVSLLKGASNPKAVYSSKGIGEPPLFLSSSVFFAIKDAIKAGRRDAGCDECFRLDSPATAERIRMSCLDQFTKQFPEQARDSYTPWSVLL